MSGPDPMRAAAWYEGYAAGARDRAQNEKNTREGRAGQIADTPCPYGPPPQGFTPTCESD